MQHCNILLTALVLLSRKTWRLLGWQNSFYKSSSNPFPSNTVWIERILPQLQLKILFPYPSVSFLHCTPGQNQFYIGVTSLLLLPSASSRPARQRQLHYMCSMSIYEVSLPIKSVRSHNSVVSVLYIPSSLFPYSRGASPLKPGLLLE